MKARVLYISGLNKKRRKYDGERIKNTLIFNSLKKKYNLSLINLSHFKFFKSFMVLLKGLFGKRKFDYVIISKDPRGSNIIHKILKFIHFPFDKVIYFEIGPFLYDRILNKSIKKETFEKDRLIVVETPSMKEELMSLGFENVDVFPNFKPVIDVPCLEKMYPVQTLKLVFLSRIEEKKGIYDLIKTIEQLNKDKKRFELDIYGRIQSSEDERMLKSFIDRCEFVHYKGKMDVGSKESYAILSKYDLHVFPTKYTEGFPGSIIDFFIAGVPTLSSSFARAHEILSEGDSIIYKQFDNADMCRKLEYIYSNQGILNELGRNSYKKRSIYSVESFEDYLDQIL